MKKLTEWHNYMMEDEPFTGFHLIMFVSIFILGWISFDILQYLLKV